MDRVEGLDGRGHRQSRALEDRPRHGNGPDRALDPRQTGMHLGESVVVEPGLQAKPVDDATSLHAEQLTGVRSLPAPPGGEGLRLPEEHAENRDRKSTRLNSSHLGISYAVFCLK